MTDYKRIILWGVVGVVVVLAVAGFLGRDFIWPKDQATKGPHLFLPQTEYDFGDIKQSGPIVSHSFEVVNDGTEDVQVEKVLASCSCTSAKMDKDVVEAGGSAILTVEFDPNYHFESYDQIMRTISIFSNASNDPRPEVKIYAKVDYDLGVERTKYGVDED